MLNQTKFLLNQSTFLDHNCTSLFCIFVLHDLSSSPPPIVWASPTPYLILTLCCHLSHSRRISCKHVEFFATTTIKASNETSALEGIGSVLFTANQFLHNFKHLQRLWWPL